MLGKATRALLEAYRECDLTAHAELTSTPFRELMLSDLSGDWVDAVVDLKEGRFAEIYLDLGLEDLLHETGFINADG